MKPASPSRSPGWPRLQWFLIPLLVLGAAEVGVRSTVGRLATWYSAAQARAAQGDLNVLFAGTSRTQVAIVCPVFESEVERRHGRHLTSLNLGRGYATDAQHFFGLKRLVREHPESLRGVTLFYEAPRGLPFVTRLRGDAWAHLEQPWMLVDLLAPAELFDFWRWSGLSVSTRLHVAMRVLLRPLALFNRRERLREELLERVLPRLARGRWASLGQAEQVGFDLRGPLPQSIRADPAAIAHARASAERVAARYLREQVPFRDYAGTLQEQIAGLVRSVGGRMVYYEPPLSAAFDQAYDTPLHREDARLFAEQARAWGACVVRPAFRHEDADLPDLWHLRRERADEFTRALAAAWLERCPPPS